MISLNVEVTLLYAGIAGLLLLLLTANILREWVMMVRKVGGAGAVSDQNLQRALKIQQSFVEYVPLILIMLLLLELTGVPKIMLYALGAAVLVARLLHAYGSGGGAGADLCRAIGAQATFVVLTIASLACIVYFGYGRLLS